MQQSWLSQDLFEIRSNSLPINISLHPLSYVCDSSLHTLQFFNILFKMSTPELDMSFQYAGNVSASGEQSQIGKKKIIAVLVCWCIQGRFSPIISPLQSMLSCFVVMNYKYSSHWLLAFCSSLLQISNVIIHLMKMGFVTWTKV